jgi:hypothetical protein
MENRNLGRARVSVPVVGLGTWRRLERTILPLAGDLGLGVLLMRPLAEGQLVRRPPGAAELAPLRPFGVTTWGQALIKWGLSDPRVHVSLAATARPERLAENTAAGSRRGSAQTSGPTCCAWPRRPDDPCESLAGRRSGEVYQGIGQWATRVRRAGRSDKLVPIPIDRRRLTWPAP